MSSEEKVRTKWTPEPSWFLRFLLFALKNRKAIRAAAKVDGSWEYHIVTAEGDQLAEIASYIEKGAIVPIVAVEAPSMEKFTMATDKLWSGRAKGKCVIKVAP